MESPHVYIIHLERRTDRKEQFTAAWAAASLPVERLHWFPAIEGIKLPPSAAVGFRTVARTRRARAGRLGAYLSHRAALAAAITANHFPLLILEDDAIPAVSATAFSTLFVDAPSSASLLYFGALPVKDRKAVPRFCSRRRRRWNPLSDSTYLYGGHAYGFRDVESATELHAFLVENPTTFDSALVRYQKKWPRRVAVRCPFAFYQAEGYSNIEGVVRWVKPMDRN